jgi:hypothetical protein
VLAKAGTSAREIILERSAPRDGGDVSSRRRHALGAHLRHGRRASHGVTATSCPLTDVFVQGAPATSDALSPPSGPNDSADVGVRSMDGGDIPSIPPSVGGASPLVSALLENSAGF